jgi:hypothetical protein
VPANGNYSITFEIYDAEVDGTQLAVVGPLNVSVTDGVYESELPLTPASLGGISRYLQITVNGELLAPRVKIVSVPYAYFSGRADAANAADIATAVAEGSIVAASIAPGAVDTAAIADAAVTGNKIGIICSVDNVLVYDGANWVCSSRPICPQGSYMNCYSGPAGTMDVGNCLGGTSECNAAGTGFGPCTGEVLPDVEQCNGEDDDCDGSTDEDGVCDSCTNGILDGSETDVDCGGVCPVCTDGQGCLVDQDCASDYCDPLDYICGPQACTIGTECGSGFCVDGYCCDSSCGGSCDACNLAGSEGTCTVTPDGLQGSPSCSPYVCDGATGSCPFSCETSADCAAGYSCNGSNQCVIAAACSPGENGTLRCSGNVIEQCDGNSWQIVQDCADTGHVCTEPFPGYAMCE